MSTGIMICPGGEHLKWEAKIIKIENEKCLEFSWPPYVEDESVDLSIEPWQHCSFELEEIPSGTLLKVTETGFDKLSPAIRDDARRGNEQGWKIKAGQILEYITKNS